MKDSLDASGSEGARIRVFVDPGAYYCRNIGDTAMLAVALQRLRRLWPLACVRVQSLDPDAISMLDAAAIPFDPFGSLGWNADIALVGGSSTLSELVGRIMDGCRMLRRRRSWLIKSLGAAALLSKRRNPRLMAAYVDAVSTSNLVVMTGAGTLNDEFKPHSFARLETLELAIESGAVTALLGQGIGPINDRVLLRRVAAILPRVDFISLRDGLASRALLRSIGVSETQLSITGDDAVPCGYHARQQTFGSAIGVNLRTTVYSGVGSDLVASIGDIIRSAAAAHGAGLIPLPVSRHGDHEDLRTAHLLIGAQIGGDAVEEYPSTPAEFLRVLPGCRVVVVGSYHAAVLALSMGIPAVTIASSEYYVQKFRGLADQFGQACRVHLTSEPAFHARLRAAIDAAWQSAATDRQELLHQSVRQIALSEAAYRRVYELVESRKSEAGSLDADATLSKEQHHAGRQETGGERHVRL